MAASTTNSKKTTQTKKAQQNKTGQKKQTGSSKKTTTTRQGKSSSRAGSGRQTQKAAGSGEIRGEITILVALGVCIILVLSNFGAGGMIGGAVSSVSFGLFGFMAYLLPFIAFGAIAFFISNKGNTHAYIKIGAAVALFWILCAILELIFNPYNASATLGSYYKAASAHKNAGGFAGGCLIKLLCPLIGEIGTCVILIILVIICVILITEKSLLSPLGRQSRRAYEEAKRMHQETAVIRAQAREERRRNAAAFRLNRAAGASGESARRMDHKVSGVSFATTLTQDDAFMPEATGEGKRGKKKSPDMRELTFETELAAAEPALADDFVINRAEPSEITLDTEEPEAQSGQKEIQGIFEAGNATTSKPTGTDVAGNSQSVTETAGTDTADDFVPDEPVMEVRSTRKNTKESAQAVAKEAASVERTIKAQEEVPKKIYRIPPLNLLTRGKKGGGDSDAHLRATALKLEQTLQNFGVGVHVTNASCGPSVTRYELQPEQGVKVSRIVGLADDIKLNLAVADLRIEAPIPGKAAVGIEVPNSENTAVMLRDLLESGEFQNSKSPISFAVGKDIAGKVVVADIAKMPHLLVAGATGSGKSVCINTLIMSIIYKADPEDVKLILVDPKVVELSVYNGIPHLMIPVVTDPKKAAGALNWAVAEMEKRYKLFAKYNVRDLKGFNEKVLKGETAEDTKKKLPQIIIIIDELADLMMVAPGEVEGAICRLAQLARAAGLHLILATQRPSVNVITGLIKANMPSRIAFSVSSGVDSRTIIDMNGAEKLLGKGDMLFYPSGYPKPVRVQGSFVSDKEVQKVVDYLIDKNGNTDYSNELEEHMVTSESTVPGIAASADSSDSRDTYFVDAGNLIIDKEKASIGMLQRMFKIGFNRAARIMDQLAEAGVVGPEEGTKPRKVLMSKEEFDEYLKSQG